MQVGVSESRITEGDAYAQNVGYVFVVWDVVCFALLNELLYLRKRECRLLLALLLQLRWARRRRSRSETDPQFTPIANSPRCIQVE